MKRRVPKRGPFAGRHATTEVTSRRRSAAKRTLHAPGKPLVRRSARAPRRTGLILKAGQTNERMRAVFVVSTVLLVAILVRVVLLQTVQSDGLLKAAHSQRVTERVLRARRGAIYASNGTALAVSVMAPTFFANPKLVKGAPVAAAALARVLKLSDAKEAALRTALADHSKSFVYVARQVDEATAAAIDALKLSGVSSYDEPRRSHPAGDLANSIVGMTDIDGMGTAGLELSYQELLAGTDGERVQLHDQRGRTIAGMVTTQLAQPGSDITLTIDPVLQYDVEAALLDQVDRLKARGGTVIVMDTKSGRVLALANARRNAAQVPVITAGNLAAVEAHDPGSVAKAFSVAAAVDQGAVTPTSRFHVERTWIFDPGTQWERKIRDAEPHPLDMSVRQIVTLSSNIGTMRIAEKIGPKVLNEYHRSFGFGASTGTGLPSETNGTLKPWNQLQGSEKATVAYGYGLSVSSLQLVAAMNTLANGGTYIAPSVIASTTDSSGVVHPAAEPVTRRVVSGQTATTMADLLTDVVCYGTAKAAQIPGISVAGKTGTAYKLQANGTYAADDGRTRSYYSSFVGYFPADNPQLTILVSIDEPDANSNERFGGTAAAPLFKRVALTSLQRLDITPVAGDHGCPAPKRR